MGENSFKDESMKRGDHLITERTGYTHHGLYLGNDKVIHYAGLVNDNLSKGSIEITSYKNFTQDKYTYIKSYNYRKYNEEESIKRACSRKGEDEYNIVFNNCEHFISWCISGISRSKQVEDKVRIIYEIIEKKYEEKIKDKVFLEMVKGIDKEIIKNTIISSSSKTILTSVASNTATIATTNIITTGAVVGVGYAVTKIFDGLFD